MQSRVRAVVQSVHFHGHPFKLLVEMCTKRTFRVTKTIWHTQATWTDTVTGPSSGTEGGNKSYSMCFYYDYNGSRTLTINLAEQTTVSQVSTSVRIMVEGTSSC